MMHTAFLEDLRAAGVPPESVDVVLCTHLHVDHVGWNTRLEHGRWVPTFPRARYLFARREWEHWSTEPDPDTARIMADSVAPIVEAGLATLVDAEHRLSSEIWLEPTPGHTPGHVSVRLRDGDADAVITGNFSNDLTLLVKAAREAGFHGKFYTFYGNALGAPAAMGDAGVGKVIAVAEWLPNMPTKESEAFYRSFRRRFPNPADDYVHMRMQMMIEALAQAIEQAGSAEAAPVATALEHVKLTFAGQTAWMRATDHQFQQTLVVGLMDKQGTPGVPFDVEGSGYGFRVIRVLQPAQAEMPTSCKMVRPD